VNKIKLPSPARIFWSFVLIVTVVFISIFALMNTIDAISISPETRRSKRIEHKVDEINEKLDHINTAIDRYVP